MNYFDFHIGDYLKDTAHLSLLEHGIYTRVLLVYYTREGPIPEAEAGRLIGARTREERAALASVLTEFFLLQGSSYVQARAEREIERYRLKQAKAKASADARWSGQRSQKMADANASPDDDARAMRTHSEGNAPHARSTHQTPDPVTKPSEEISSLRDSSAARLPTCPHAEIVRHFHETLPSLPRIKMLDSKSRKANLTTFWRWVLTSTKTDGARRATSAAEALTWIRGYFERAATNDFLMGRTSRSEAHASWRCTLDFLLTERGRIQVIERTGEATQAAGPSSYETPHRTSPL